MKRLAILQFGHRKKISIIQLPRFLRDDDTTKEEIEDYITNDLDFRLKDIKYLFDDFDLDVEQF